MTTDLTVIMCAYNEMGRIQPALDDWVDATERRSESYEVLIIDNGSTDGTREFLSELNLPNVTVVLNETNLGKGGSIKKGFALSTGRYVVIHDPDMEYRAADVWKVFEAAEADGSAMVLGSRILDGEVKYKYVANYLGVKFLTGVINVLFGSRITDSATALKLMDGDIARRMNWKSSGFDLDFEMVVRVLRLGHRISERNAEYWPRTREEGKKIKAWRDGLMALRAIVRDRVISSDGFVLPEESPQREPTSVERR